MRTATFLSLVTSGMLALSGCSFAPTAHAPDFGANAVVANSNLGGKQTATINLATPTEAGFLTQAVVHRWVENDIFQYEATLRIWNGTAYVDFASPLTVVLPRKGAAPKTSAVFTNLKQGSKYQVSVVAKGNVGGTLAASVLNANTATAGVFDFTATQDVENSLTSNLQIAFDAVPFSGTGTTTVVAPADGSYTNPTAPETGTAQ